MKHEIIKAIKELAQSNYNTSYGWSVIVECLTDKELWDYLEHMKRFDDENNEITLEWAIQEMTEFAKAQTEQFQEIQSTIW